MMLQALKIYLQIRDLPENADWKYIWPTAGTMEPLSSGIQPAL